jgi:3-oxoacyl-[acyl-carrier-protein] synthase-3
VVERTRILGVGRSLPERVVTNDDLSRVMETSDDWIQQRTGIRERRHVGADCGATDLGKIAAEEALRKAGLDISEIDLIVFATLSPDIDWPASACLLACEARCSEGAGVRRQESVLRVQSTACRAPTR